MTMSDKSSMPSEDRRVSPEEATLVHLVSPDCGTALATRRGAVDRGRVGLSRLRCRDVAGL